MLLFIQKEKRQWRTWIYFNTSHVTVYQQISVFDSSGVTHFNTSHVTVYHVAHGGYNAACLFQYISCYCLSLLVDSLPCPDHISIHLMLLFILLPVCSLLCMSRISIHLMLLFIEFGRFLNKLSDHFNTSHVTVYLPKDETEEIDVWFQYISCYCLS